MKNRVIYEDPLFFSMTLEFLEIYMPKQLGRSPETIKSYRDSLTIFRRYLYNERKISIRKFSFEDCNARVIQDFIIFLKESGNSPGTCNQRLTAIRTYLWFAADRNFAFQSVALVISKIPPCKVPKKEKAILSEEALSCIFRQPGHTKIGMRDRVIMILLYDSAIRLNELLSLKIQDLMLEASNPYIRINGKGNKERIVAITQRTAEHLIQYLKVFHPHPDRKSCVFYTKIKGQTGKMSESNVERFISLYSCQAREKGKDVPQKVYPHMFRRTRATNLYQNGVELALICDLSH